MDKKHGAEQAPRKEVSFNLGSIFITPAAQEVLTYEDTLSALSRHARGDWGECCEEDWQENDFSLAKRLRLLSVYQSKAGVKFWIITEADRSATTILLPSDY